jgi:class 3 adenylate cyclase
LVDRYIDLDTWPTSRKTAFLTGYWLPFQLIFSAICYLGVSGVPGLVKARVLGIYLVAWAAAVALLFVASLATTRLGREGRWTVHVLILVYGGFIIGFIHLFGITNSPFLVFYFASPVMVLLVYDVRVGALAVAFGTIGWVSVAALSIAEVVPSAPLLQLRSLDAQVHWGWFFGVVVTVFGICLANLSPIQLAISARVRQQRQLAAAHEELRRVAGRLERSTSLIRRYVPTQLAEKILAGEHSGAARPERRKLTIFFSDVVGFTEAADRMEAEDLSTLLNEYLAEMAAVADSAGATINQFVGDGIMIFFGAPDATSDRDHALRAVRMALAMQRRMAELSEKWFAEGIGTPFQIRVGINTGVASVGDFGSEGRTTYSAIGNQTNLTARVQDHCEPGKVLISHTTWALVKEEIPCEERGEIEVKGLHYPVRVYEVSEEAPPVAGDG